MKKTRQRARARRLTLKQRRAKIARVILDQWAEMQPQHREKITSHTIDVAMQLIAIDQGIDLETITVLFASAAVVKLIATVQAIALSRSASIDEVALEMCDAMVKDQPANMSN